jgi:hypothetical protein
MTHLPVLSRSPNVLLLSSLSPFPFSVRACVWRGLRFQRTVRRVRRCSQRRTATDTAETQRQRHDTDRGEEEQRHMCVRAIFALLPVRCVPVCCPRSTALCPRRTRVPCWAGSAALRLREGGTCPAGSNRENRGHANEQGRSLACDRCEHRCSFVGCCSRPPTENVPAPTQRSSNSVQRWGEKTHVPELGASLTPPSLGCAL